MWEGLLQLHLDADRAFASDQSSSQASCKAIAVYGPGSTSGRLKVPSLSLWSRRKRVQLLSGLRGTRTTIAPANGLSSRKTTPVTLATACVAVHTNCTLPPLISMVCPTVFAPLAIMLLIWNPGAFASTTSYLPGRISSSLKSKSPLFDTSAEKFSREMRSVRMTYIFPGGRIALSINSAPLTEASGGLSRGSRSVVPERSTSLYQPERRRPCP
jgi:hypothetical protein